ncbi:hypothetical protein B0H17DRAFT_1038885 [Mycena rosella]|uniref:F-box domain-containing protein n=1 Tax=Mycena rosella TaxID=1033263 RepID=A0AAD7GTH4_MYCRO|nr:hypothetical protein B0H17DRAFT_1038885 [Mycena rosella]
MAFVATLRTRLEELSSAISRQKEVLKSLEQTRSDVQRDLNAILDPMARLPLEISSDILMRSIPAISLPHSSRAPLVFLKICHLWSHIALSTPALWAAIRIDSSRAREFNKFFETWIIRARTHPLTISLRGSLDDGIQDLLKHHARRLQNLELYLDSGEPLENLTLELSSLKSLTIGSDVSTAYVPAFFFNADGCVETLRAAPDLVECDFDNIYYEEDIHAIGNTLGPLTHTSLQILRLGRHGSDNNTTCILQYLTLPSLHTLSITDFDISHEDFLSFLGRSSPPLQSLYMNVPIEGWRTDTIHQYFRLLPTLTDLDLHQYDFGFLDVLAALGDDFLPNLCHLTIRGYMPDRSEYEKLVSTLTARRAYRHSPLQSFRLVWQLLDWDDAPEADITEALRQLRANGMHIHVGIEEITYI